MTFVPRVPLTAAERHVDFAAHNDHIVAQRTRIETACTPATKRLAVLADEFHGAPPLTAIAALETALRTGLDRTARFGAASVTAELAALRAPDAVTAGWTIPDAGRYANIAADGIEGVLRFLARRASETARAIAAAAATAVQEAEFIEGLALAQALQASARSLHNHVLELVGETLNLGRTAAAMSSPVVPEFALRSEQLDTNTCPPCDDLHGTIVQVGTPDFYAILPPTGCLGGGRCRGIMVFGDTEHEVRQPIRIAA